MNQPASPSERELNGSAAAPGCSHAPQALLPRVYDELRAIANGYLQRERTGHTLQPTALVHEAYMRLSASESQPWRSEGEFIAIAASVMRKVLVDHARRRDALKRNGVGHGLRLTLDHVHPDEHPSNAAPDVDLLELEDSLSKLEALSPRQARLVELRYFGGLTINAAADILDISRRTAAYEWRMARAWLLQELGG